MRIKLLVAAAGLVAFATPSLAAEYFIVQDTTSKRCTIVEQRPTTQTTTIVGGTTYTTRTEAEGAMKTVKVCESGGTVGGPVHRLLVCANTNRISRTEEAPGSPGASFT